MSFRRPVVTRLITALESHSLPNLTANEQAHLIVLIQTVLEVGSPVIRFQCMIYLFKRRSTNSGVHLTLMASDTLSQ